MNPASSDTAAIASIPAHNRTLVVDAYAYVSAAAG
jgi:hypothetical protein